MQRTLESDAWAASRTGLLWLLAALVLLGAEALTLQFVLVYFGLGAVVAAVVSAFAGPAAQGIAFAISAVVLMVSTRGPLVAWSQRQHGADTNVDTIAGRSAGRHDHHRQPRQHGSDPRRRSGSSLNSSITTSLPCGFHEQ